MYPWKAPSPPRVRSRFPRPCATIWGSNRGDKVIFTYLEAGGIRIEPALRRQGRKAAKGGFAALRGRAGKVPRTDALMELLRGYAGDAKDPGFGK